MRPDELVDAHQALSAAEAAHEEEPGGVEEKHLAYLAKRRAELAASRGRRAKLEQERGEKRQALLSKAKSYAYEAKDQLSEANQQIERREGEIARTEQELAEERRKREQAESLAASAMEDLKRVALVKEESRGFVITLSGAVLFASGESELLQTARSRLAQVADALKQQDGDKKFVIEGHTDARGSDKYNRQLSLDRANAVRNYLVERGVEQDRLEAKGVGEAQPIADNSTAEGRANNRRVEIIVQN